MLILYSLKKQKFVHLLFNLNLPSVLVSKNSTISRFLKKKISLNYLQRIFEILYRFWNCLQLLKSRYIISTELNL